MAVFVFKKIFNFYKTHSGNLENLTLGFFKILAMNMRQYF